MSQETPALVVDDLHKSYGRMRAVDGLSFSIQPGAVLGLLGSNGAGKSTAVRIISTLTPCDRGTVRVLGHNVESEKRDVRALIGLTGQFSALDDNLTAYENLEMIARLYHLGAVEARRRATELLEMFDLARAATQLVKTYSGGMRRRLDLAASLTIEPRLLIFDEPTTGLDPRSRQNVWHLIRDLVSTGSSVLLTTQYLEEADELADNIVVLDKGITVAHGTPKKLKDTVGDTRIEVRLTGVEGLPAASSALQRLSSGAISINAHERILTFAPIKISDLFSTVVRTLDDLQIRIDDVHLRKPTLDDVFLALTGDDDVSDESRTA